MAETEWMEVNSSCKDHKVSKYTVLCIGRVRAQIG